MDVIAFLNTHPVFTRDEFALALGYDPAQDGRAVKKSLDYYASTGRIAPIRRGLYASAMPGIAVGHFEVAGKAAADAVIAYHSALELLGHAYTLTSEVHFVTAQRSRPFEFRGTRFHAHRPPASLVAAGQADFGVEEVGGVRTTGFERTFVDVLDRPDLGGGWEEICRAADSIPFVDPDRVIDYCGLLGNATVAAKAGWFLEKHRERWAVREAQLEALERLRPVGAHYFDRSKDHHGRLATRWNLIVPEWIATSAWEEPT